LQSIGCNIVSSWSCNREFDFTEFEDIRKLQFITSGSAVIDNVQLITFEGGGSGAVPEPSTLALVGLGLLGTAVRRRVNTTRPACA
jgi:hypothetical protein